MKTPTQTEAYRVSMPDRAFGQTSWLGLMKIKPGVRQIRKYLIDKGLLKP